MPRVAAYTICPANAYEAIGTPGLRSPEMIPSGVPARILSEDELRCGCQRWHGPDHDSVSSRTTQVCDGGVSRLVWKQRSTAVRSTRWFAVPERALSCRQ
jgi:hypothetical protein